MLSQGCGRLRANLGCPISLPGELHRPEQNLREPHLTGPFRAAGRAQSWCFVSCSVCWAHPSGAKDEPLSPHRGTTVILSLPSGPRKRHLIPRRQQKACRCPFCAPDVDILTVAPSSRREPPRLPWASWLQRHPCRGRAGDRLIRRIFSKLQV